MKWVLRREDDPGNSSGDSCSNSARRRINQEGREWSAVSRREDGGLK